MSTLRYPDVYEGDTATQITFSRTYDDGSGNLTRARFASGTIEVLDAAGALLSGFDPAVACSVSADGYKLTFRLAGWEGGAGEASGSLTADAMRYVKWYGVDTDGNDVVSGRRAWLHKPRRA